MLLQLIVLKWCGFCHLIHVFFVWFYIISTKYTQDHDLCKRHSVYTRSKWYNHGWQSFFFLQHFLRKYLYDQNLLLFFLLFQIALCMSHRRHIPTIIRTETPEFDQTFNSNAKSFYTWLPRVHYLSKFLFWLNASNKIIHCFIQQKNLQCAVSIETRIIFNGIHEY